jgi:hypothetical protein
MAYYASAIDGSRKVLGVGPFRRHGDALAVVDRFRRWAEESTREGRYRGPAYGTCRDFRQHKPGRFNEQVGVTVGADGWVERELA